VPPGQSKPGPTLVEDRFGSPAVAPATTRFGHAEADSATRKLDSGRVRSRDFSFSTFIPTYLCMGRLSATAEPVHAAADSDRLIDPVENALLTLLERHPTAQVFAVGGESSPKVVAFPPGVPVGRHQVLDNSQLLLEQVVPPDRAGVAKLWGRARVQGAAVVPVRLLSDPELVSSLYFLDLRNRYDAMIAVFAEGHAADNTIVQTASLPPLPPRLARAIKDVSSTFESVDPALAEILGWSPDELIGRRAIEFVHPEDRETGIANWMEMLDSPGTSRRVRLRHMHRDGSWVWMEVSNENHLTDKAHPHVVSEMVDISDEMSALEALRAREQLLAQLTDTVPVGLFHVDLDSNLLFANRRLREITGAGVGSTLSDHLATVHPEDRPSLDEAVRIATSGAPVDVVIRVLPEYGGSIRHCTVSMRPLRSESGAVEGVTGCVDDVTVNVLSRQELEARAATDPLTGCFNRVATFSALQELLDRSHSGVSLPGSGTAVIFADIDRLKPVNDVMGHAAGDELLMRVAERIQCSVRSGDLVGRLGGDEFLVVCPGVSSAADALTLAASLASRAFGCHMDLPGGSVAVRASIGVAWTDAPGAQADQLVREADIAMYQSKREGRSEPVMVRRPES